MESLTRYASPINPSVFPHLATVLLIIGTFFTSWFFVFVVSRPRHFAKSNTVLKELLISLFAAAFLGFGVLFLLLSVGIYVWIVERDSSKQGKWFCRCSEWDETQFHSFVTNNSFHIRFCWCNKNAIKINFSQKNIQLNIHNCVVFFYWVALLASTLSAVHILKWTCFPFFMIRVFLNFILSPCVECDKK